MHLLTCLVFLVCPALVVTFSYECYPNDTIVVDNTDVNQYRSSWANDTDQICTTSYNSAYTELTITDCNMDDDILLVFTNRTIEDQMIIGGIVNEAYIIRCNDIPDVGVTRTVIQGFSPTMVTEAPVTSISPSLLLESALRLDYAFGTAAEISAVLATALYWTIDIPIEYYGIPVSCTVKSGSNFFDSNALSKTLIITGCSQDADLVGNFGSEITNVGLGVRRMYTVFYVFKFYNSDYISLGCTVAYCKKASDCSVGCSGRKRRDLSAALKGEHLATTTLRITDDIIGSSAATLVPGTLVILASCLLLIQ